MRKLLIGALLVAVLPFLFAPPVFAQADTQWILEQSALTYHMTHPIHQVYGTSHAAKGKGVCHAGECDFLIDVPVKSFDSGDSNRDLHMLEVTRGAQFPMVIVRTRFPQAATASPTIYANLDVQFAGVTAHYSRVPFQRAAKGNDVEITGTIPATCSDFKIPPPSFLTVPIKNEIPVQVDMTWRQAP
ncbi:MAG: YceI family protein [Acidobacteriaceae bacterium]